MSTLNHADKHPPTLSEGSRQQSVHGTSRTTQSSAYERNITDLRPQIIREMDREMLTCKVNEFEEFYLPFVPSSPAVTACAERLRDKGILEFMGGNKYLMSKTYVPTESKHKESLAFGVIRIIAQEISDTYKALNPLEEPTLEYQEYPNTILKSELPGANFKIDGFLGLTQNSGLKTQGQSSSNTPDAAVIFEYKKHRTLNTSDNRAKIVSAACHIMNDDPRRAFMFGVTMEGNMMSIWYFSRSHSTMSVAFDYTKKPKQLISIFLSFLFGKPPLLGYDPAIRRVDGFGPGIYYEYEIESEGIRRYYKTSRALSSYRALRITGRMTRVWEATEITGPNGSDKPGTNKVALKDVWLDEGAESELEIQRKIFAAIENDKDPKRNERLSCFQKLPLSKIKGQIENKKYRDYFVKIDLEGKNGAITKAKPPPAKPTPGLFTSPEPKSGGFLLEGSCSRGGPSPAHTLSRETEQVPEYVPREYLQKRRCFLIYSNVGEALHHAKDLQTVFRALTDTIYALAFLFVADWVHRDVSVGNIIVVGNGNDARGMLSDLEYAKVFNSQRSSPDPKTGTPFFMAHELLFGSPLFHVAAQERPQTTIVEVDGEFMIGPFLSVPPPSSIKIIYNFQHDLESIWWIALWFLVGRVKHEPSQNFADTIFVNNISNPTQQRRHNFTIPSCLRHALEDNLHPSLTMFIEPLDVGRHDLLAAYESRQDVLDRASYQHIFHEIIAVIMKCHKLAKQVENLTLGESRKRSHSAGPGEESDNSDSNRPREDPRNLGLV